MAIQKSGLNTNSDLPSIPPSIETPNTTASAVPPPASQVTLDWSQSIIARCERGLEKKFGIERNTFAGLAGTFPCFVGGIISYPFEKPEPEILAAVNLKTPVATNSTSGLTLGLVGPGLPVGTSASTAVTGGGISATQIGLMFLATVIILDQHYGTDFNSALDHRINSLKLYASHDWERLVDKISPRVADASPVQILNITQVQQEIVDAVERGETLNDEQLQILKDAFGNSEEWAVRILENIYQEILNDPKIRDNPNIRAANIGAETTLSSLQSQLLDEAMCSDGSAGSLEREFHNWGTKIYTLTEDRHNQQVIVEKIKWGKPLDEEEKSRLLEAKETGETWITEIEHQIDHALAVQEEPLAEYLKRISETPDSLVKRAITNPEQITAEDLARLAELLAKASKEGKSVEKYVTALFRISEKHPIEAIKSFAHALLANTLQAEMSLQQLPMDFEKLFFQMEENLKKGGDKVWELMPLLVSNAETEIQIKRLLNHTDPRVRAACIAFFIAKGAPVEDFWPSEQVLIEQDLNSRDSEVVWEAIMQLALFSRDGIKAAYERLLALATDPKRENAQRATDAQSILETLESPSLSDRRN